MHRDLRCGGALVQQAAGKDPGAVSCHAEQPAEVRPRPVLIVWLGNNMKTIITAAVSVAVFGSILTLYNGFLSMDPIRSG